MSDKQDALEHAARQYEDSFRWDHEQSLAEAFVAGGKWVAALDASPRPEVQAGYFAVCNGLCDLDVNAPNRDCPVHGEHPVGVTTTSAPEAQGAEWVASPHAPGLPQDYGYEPDETPDAKSEPREPATGTAADGETTATSPRTGNWMGPFTPGPEASVNGLASVPVAPEVQEEAEAREAVWIALYDGGCDYDAGCHVNDSFQDDWICDSCEAKADDLIDTYAAAVRGTAEARIAGLWRALPTETPDTPSTDAPHA